MSCYSRRDREHVIVFERRNPADRKEGEPEVLACATLVVEHKFIHGGRCVGTGAESEADHDRGRAAAEAAAAGGSPASGTLALGLLSPGRRLDFCRFYCLGHVEDVVVDSSTRGTGLGKMMVGQLTDMALAAGCYKILLNCVAACKNAPWTPCLGLRCATWGCTMLGTPSVQGGGATGHLRRLIKGCTLAAGAEKNIGFYEKCGYVVKEVSMAKYLDH